MSEEDLLEILRAVEECTSATANALIEMTARIRALEIAVERMQGHE